MTQRFNGSVSIIATASNTVVDTEPVGFIPRGVAVTLDGTRVYVANSVADTVSVINGCTNMAIDTISVGDQPIAFGKFISPLGVIFADGFDCGDAGVWSMTFP